MFCETAKVVPGLYLTSEVAGLMASFCVLAAAAMAVSLAFLFSSIALRRSSYRSL